MNCNLIFDIFLRKRFELTRLSKSFLLHSRFTCLSTLCAFYLNRERVLFAKTALSSCGIAEYELYSLTIHVLYAKKVLCSTSHALIFSLTTIYILLTFMAFI